jgi:signal transduction histidine kinase
MELINDILDYAKAEAGMIKIAREVIALPELVNQTITIVTPKAEEKNMTVTAHVDPEVRELVADPLRLRQILLNLLNNAVKYNDPGGLVKLQVRASGSAILISVRDTGRGITKDQMEHLFDPYYQAAHGDQGIGTGLGLSITKRLVELHEGRISVESVPGTGSVFTVELPSNAVPDVEADSPEEEVLAAIQDTIRSGSERQEETGVLCEY